MKLNKEYFQSPYYFFLKEDKDGGILYYSMSHTIVESRTKKEKIKVDKSDLGVAKKVISKILSDKSIKNLSQLKKILGLTLGQKDDKKDGEISEFVDATGAFKSSRIPPINHTLTQSRTTDQIILNRMTNNPITRGYRRYYGESVEDEIPLTETDFSDAFGYEETKNMNGKKTFNYFVDELEMDPIEAIERTKQFGKDPSGKKTKRAPKRIRKQKGFIDRMTLAEMGKDKAVKMIEDLLINKNNTDSELMEKGDPIKKLLQKNINSLKAMAEKNGITVAELLKMFKSE
jgi:hypothetical protein